MSVRPLNLSEQAQQRYARSPSLTQSSIQKTIGDFYDCLWPSFAWRGENADGDEFEAVALAELLSDDGLLDFLIITNDADGGLTLLERAACEGGVNFLAYLFTRLGPRLDLNNIRNLDGETPVFAAIRGGSYAAVKLLVEHGADLNIEDGLGYYTGYTLMESSGLTLDGQGWSDEPPRG